MSIQPSKWPPARLIAWICFASCACSLPNEKQPLDHCQPSRPPYQKTFFWGAGTYALMEGGNQNDWTAFIDMKGMDSVATSADLIGHVEEDASLAAQAGFTMLRMQIDWARLEPTPGQFDPEAVAYYHRVFDALRSRGITPHVTLHWWIHPLWVIDPMDPTFEHSLGGWLNPQTVDRFVEFVAFVASEYGSEVDWWLTFNEPINFLVATYLAGSYPSREPNALSLGFDLTGPDQKNLPALQPLMLATHHLLTAHARAYRAIHELDQVDADGDGQNATVTIAHQIRDILPVRADNQDDIAAAKRLDYLYNQMILKALVYGLVDYDLDGDSDGILNDFMPDTNDLDPTPVSEGTHAELAHTLDHLGVNYYGSFYVETGGLLVLPIIDGWLGPIPAGRPVSDNGTEIRPEGLQQKLVELWGSYCLPMLITENGIDDADDSDRLSFLIDHLDAIESAKTDGANIMGYLHWGFMDHWEWLVGYKAKFWLVAIDYQDQRSAIRTRTPRPSLDVFRQIISAQGVTAELRQRYRNGYSNFSDGTSSGGIPFFP